MYHAGMNNQSTTQCLLNGWYLTTFNACTLYLYSMPFVNKLKLNVHTNKTFKSLGTCYVVT